jgi:WD40 repeat protein
VTGGADGFVHLWNLATRDVRDIEIGAPVTAVAVSPDGDELAVAAQDSAVRLYDVRTLKPRGKLEQNAAALDVAFDPSGTRIATAGADAIARIWEDGQIAHELKGHTDDVTSVAFGPGGRFVVTASRDHDVRVWNAATGDLVRVIKAHFALVSDVAVSADGRWIATAGPSRAGLFTTAGIGLPQLRGHDGRLTAVAFAPTGHRIATGGEDGSVRVYTCEVCGRVPALLRLADERLDAARRR